MCCDLLYIPVVVYHVCTVRGYHTSYYVMYVISKIIVSSGLKEYKKMLIPTACVGSVCTEVFA